MLFFVALIPSNYPYPTFLTKPYPVFPKPELLSGCDTMEVSNLITHTKNTWIDACLELPPNQYDTKNTSWVLLGKLITNKVVGTSIVSDVVNKVWRLVTNNPSESTREQYLHVPFPSWSRYGQCLLQEALVHPRRTPSLKAMESFPHMARDILHIINILGTNARPSKAVEIFEQPPTTRRKSRERYWGDLTGKAGGS